MAGPIPAADEPAILSLRGVSKRYHEGETEHVVLDGVDLDIRRGELVALLGPSGSGKSTLLNVIAGIDPACAGEVTIAGTSIARLSDRERTLFRRRHVGFVFQFFNLIPTLTVEENLRLPLELNRIGDGDGGVRSLLESVGLGARATSYPDRLSGGEQQRVAIARALVHSPELLLADEPTGNLDAATGDVVLDVLERLTREQARTLLVATHSDRIVERADRVLVLRAGRIAEGG
ncbi:MAG: ABC transporter ATP-binding protein [Longimicrobiales bacterium]